MTDHCWYVALLHSAWHYGSEEKTVTYTTPPEEEGPTECEIFLKEFTGGAIDAAPMIAVFPFRVCLEGVATDKQLCSLFWLSL